MREFSIRILCWNLHGLAWPLSKDPGGRMDRVASRIRELMPDLVLLQEVWLGSYLERLAAALGPDWIPVCVRRRSRSARGGLLTLVRDAAGWKVRGAPEFHAFGAGAPAWKIWEGDGFAGKGILAAELERGEERIWAVNLHLQSQYSGSDYFKVREAQLAEVSELVSHLDGSAPAIVAGDFNTDSREALYSLVAGLGTDLTTRYRERAGCGTTASSTELDPEWIDYIVAARSQAWSVSADLELIANQRADVPYSDHSGLFCIVRMALAR